MPGPASRISIAYAIDAAVRPWTAREALNCSALPLKSSFVYVMILERL